MSPLNTLSALTFLFAVSCAHMETPSVMGADVSHLPIAEVQRLPQPPELEDKVLSIDPESVTERDITEVLSKFPAPRIFNLNGSIPIVTMGSFSKFLISMGYPERSVRDPVTGSYSYSGHRSSEKLAGLIAWYYEREGMMPMLIGHSQGGMLSIKVLHEFDGAFSARIAVVDPYHEEAVERYAITDPLTGVERPVVGLRVGFASAIATGKLMRIFFGQWYMLSKLRRIPDSVEEFTGFHIKNDLIGGDLFGLLKGNKYYPAGSAVVRNVMLPAEYSHIKIPLTESLAMNPEAKNWINSYRQSSENLEAVPDVEGKGDNVLFAADIWRSIKKHWCVELQRLIRARKGAR